MTLKNQKQGIAMIELIFSLVIMGIVLMSAPMLIQQSIRSGNVALQQEAIAAAASQTNIVLSMHWDETNSNIPIGTSPILDTNRTPFDFNMTTLPAGLLNVSGRNIEDNSQTLSPHLIGSIDINETSFTEFDDVDDYHGTNFGLLVFNHEQTSADIGDYVDVNITMNTQINYTQDRVSTGDTTLIGPNIVLNNNINNTPLGVNSNIKFVHVNLTSNSGIKELDKNITLEAFSCNIGTSIPSGAVK